jgi:hypothetical protein
MPLAFRVAIVASFQLSQCQTIVRQPDLFHDADGSTNFQDKGYAAWPIALFWLSGNA